MMVEIADVERQTKSFMQQVNEDHEVMQKDGSVSSIPILRLPICSTNMRIIR
jgi:hypothetical protein